MARKFLNPALMIILLSLCIALPTQIGYFAGICHTIKQMEIRLDGGFAVIELDGHEWLHFVRKEGTK